MTGLYMTALNAERTAEKKVRGILTLESTQDDTSGKWEYSRSGAALDQAGSGDLAENAKDSFADPGRTRQPGTVEELLGTLLDRIIAEGLAHIVL
jgi:hypothetical protein